MRKILCLLFCLVFLLLTACGKQQTAVAPKTEVVTLPKVKTVPTPTTWEMIDALPIATDDMTEDELRQLCVDFFRLQQSVQWTLTEDLAYDIKTYGKHPELKAGTPYAGCFYVSPSVAGNLYRIMDFYDSETGVLTNPGMEPTEFALLLGNDCVSGPFWGWGRVVNSVAVYSNSYITKEYGCIPVGPYDYEGISKWSEENSTKSVCDANGRHIMYDAYASVKPADGIYTQWNIPANSHMRMISAAPVVVRNEHGMIDGNKSYIIYIDQGSSWEEYNWDNTDFWVQGDVDVQVSFEDLYSNGYLPFTFAELIGEDPIEPAVVSTVNPIPETVTIKDLLQITFYSNYAISHYSLELRDSAGNVTYQKTLYMQHLNERSSSTGSLITTSQLQELLQSGPQTVCLTCRISTGQLMTIYNGSLES